MARLSHAQTAFLQDNAFVGVATTLRADGSPHSTVVWVDADGDSVSFNTARGRAKERNILRDPRLSLVVVDPQNAYRWLAVTGTAELVDEGADAHIDKLAKKYLGADSYPFRTPEEVRVIVRIRPARVDSMGLEE
ncbi:PPOX class putative F420-dependent enzyme [Gaiella occulta]|uniref:PPOX class putative F420-dependent enzyme n=1 Tax=Gaiella occulta TaxID=1002870 RepID=A0A7M2YW61_9ACTN|nr:PPOX class F420-dependent oxidoreductase [Gaiella occulta]RDI73687.1 PPOX class putative F420-dependent enzyme [Gaiella occulta]